MDLRTANAAALRATVLGRPDFATGTSRARLSEWKEPLAKGTLRVLEFAADEAFEIPTLRRCA
jgi:hypothetical protein